jgi:hypothetical protein
MNYFLKKCTLYLFIFLLAFSLIECFSRLDNNNAAFSVNPNIIKIQNKSLFDSLDMLLMGNSYLYSAIQPNIINKHTKLETFNLGIATAGVEFYDLIVDDYLKHTKVNPKVLVVLTNRMLFSHLSDNFVSYPIHRYLESPMSNLSLTLKTKNIKELYPLMRTSLDKSWDFLRNSVPKYYINQTDSIIYLRGFIPSKGNYGDSQSDKNYEQLSNEDFNYNTLSKLKNWLSKIESTGIKVVILQIPTNKLDSYFNLGYNLSYLHAMDDLSSSYEFINVPDSGFDANSFRDLDHMNSTGATKATLLFIESLQNLNLFKNY